MRTATPEEKALWPTPNFKNPEKLHGLVIGVTVTTFSLAIISLTARIVGKRLLRQSLKADDHLILGAMLVAIPMSIFPLVCLNFGLGLHIWDQKPEWHTLYAKLGFASDILFPVACSLTKISQCLSYLQLFPGRSNEIFCHVMIVFITTYTITCILLSMLQCRPIRGHWNPDVALECLNMRATLAAIAALNSFSDFLVYLRPAEPLWNLQLPAKQRVGLSLLFTMSLLVCIAGTLRLYYLEAFYDSVDELWNASVVWATMLIEMNLGVVCGCLFGVQPVFAMLFPRLFANSYPSQAHSPSHTHRQSSNHFESFEAYPLSDLSPKSRDKARGEADAFETLWTPEGRGSNFAVASSSGRKRSAQLTPGVITVDRVFTVQEEVTPCHSPTGELDRKLHLITDIGSEEWTLDDVCLGD